jgi:hypothetical protein
MYRSGSWYQWTLVGLGLLGSALVTHPIAGATTPPGQAAGVSGAEKAPPPQEQQSTEKPASKKRAPLPEMRIGAALTPPRTDSPDRPGEPNLASRIFENVALEMAVQAHRGEWAPLFQSTPTRRGLRVTCNHRGNRYSYEIVGDKVREGTPPYTSWIVDGRLLQVLSQPLKEGEPLNEGRLLREPREDFARTGWDVVSGSLETLKGPRGEKAEYVELVPGKAVSQSGNIARAQIVKVQIATTLNRRNLLTIGCPVRKGDDERKGSQLVRQTFLSLKRLPDLPARKAPLTADDLRDRGLTLKEGLYVNESLLGEKWGALVNEEWASLEDRHLSRVVLLPATELLREVRLHLLAGQGDLNVGPGAGRKGRYGELQVAVFDGATAHAIVLRSYDRGAGRYIYWEPWGKGTFLGRGNNRAGVAARPQPSERKFFSVTEKELGEVLYAVSAPWEVLEPDHRLLELLNGPEAQVVDALRKMHEKDPQNTQTREQRLLSMGRFLLLEEQPRKAALAFRACRALDPESVRALVGLGDAQRAAGDQVGAAPFYRQALAELAGDKRLSLPDREALEKQIRDGLSTSRPGVRQPNKER